MPWAISAQTESPALINKRCVCTWPPHRCALRWKRNRLLKCSQEFSLSLFPSQRKTQRRSIFYRLLLINWPGDSTGFSEIIFFCCKSSTWFRATQREASVNFFFRLASRYQHINMRQLIGNLREATVIGMAGNSSRCIRSLTRRLCDICKIGNWRIARVNVG